MCRLFIHPIQRFDIDPLDVTQNYFAAGRNPNTAWCRLAYNIVSQDLGKINSYFSNTVGPRATKLHLVPPRPDQMVPPFVHEPSICILAIPTLMPIQNFCLRPFLVTKVFGGCASFVNIFFVLRDIFNRKPAWPIALTNSLKFAHASGPKFVRICSHAQNPWSTNLEGTSPDENSFFQFFPSSGA